MTERGVGFSGGALSEPAATAAPEDFEIGLGRSPWQLAWRRFRKNRLAIVGGVILGVFYVVALFAPFCSPYDYAEFHTKLRYAPPQTVHIIDQDGKLSWPFVYETKMQLDLNTMEISYREINQEKSYSVRLLVPGTPYRLLGIIPARVRLFGVEEGGYLFLLGTDELGRDMLSRIIGGSQVSLSVPLVGTLISIVLGSILGIASGYFGRMVDHALQRFIEVLVSFPRIPLWIALAAAIPAKWPPQYVYLGVIVILSLLGWGSLARVVRGKVLAYRGSEYVLAAQAVGAGPWRIITRHLLPGSLSHIIVVATLSIPGLILGESALSFLGIGVVPPMVSWGVLLQDAQRVQVLVNHVWLATPALLIILVVLCFNFLGDGIRDAFDPFST